MKKSLNLTLALGLGVLLAGCATKMDPTTKAPGFLPNYSLLKPIPSPDGTQIYSYKSPDAKLSDYHAAIITPVALYQTATESGVTAEQIEQARTNINKGIQQIVSKKLPITDKSAPGVARVNVAITGATLEGEGFSVRNLIPISAAIKLASMATGLDNKKPIMVVEIKVVDSQTDKLLKETVTTISGEKFRMNSNAVEEFQKLATEWVQQALKYSSSD
ncbi:MAG: DUF3313 domain-containing protein [Burkholderiales bacterium]|nr:DUF3313 domain-containing protein [Burkholderiales bacterium]